MCLLNADEFLNVNLYSHNISFCHSISYFFIFIRAGRVYKPLDNFMALLKSCTRDLYEVLSLDVPPRCATACSWLGLTFLSQLLFTFVYKSIY